MVWTANLAKNVYENGLEIFCPYFYFYGFGGLVHIPTLLSLNNRYIHSDIKESKESCLVYQQKKHFPQAKVPALDGKNLTSLNASSGCSFERLGQSPQLIDVWCNPVLQWF